MKTLNASFLSASRRVALPAVLALAALGFACGGTSDAPEDSTSTTTSEGSSVTGFVFIGDAPPPGSTILEFELTLETATLCPQVGSAGECQGSPQVSLLSEAVEIELEGLQLETAFLDLAEVPTGTYQGVHLTFSSPELTLLLEDGTLEELEPPDLVVDPSSVTPTFDGGLEVTQEVDFGFLVDINVFDSIQTDASGEVSIAPVVSLARLPAGPGEEIEELEDVTGRVSNLNKSCPTGTFTLVQSATGLPIDDIEFDETTEFEADDDDDTVFDCLALANDQVVEVDLVLRAGASGESSNFFAEEIEQEGAPDEEELEGVVFSVNSSTEFVVLVREQEGLPELSLGNFVTIAVMSSTEFELDDDDVSVPDSVSFASSADLLVGQKVEVELADGSLVIPEGSSCGAPEDGCTATAEEVELKESTVTATVASVNDPDFTLEELPSLFGNAEALRPLSADCQLCFVESLLVRTASETEFRDSLTGVGDLAVGDTVSVRGLLLKGDFGPPEPGQGQPQLAAERVRRRD